ncbi:AAA family ATPase [Pseudomonas sp. F1_0610]|uniref:AAA family ATPase n=1 Tax=Pseudomonas sp. F1_0610 TaxID=3114284 RepID=UPI0039C00364
MKVVVLSGPESVGKSSLCQALAKEFNAIVVDEYVRTFIEEQGRTTCYADIDSIARQQLTNELLARAKKPKLVLLDTHLLTNKLWSEYLFTTCPEWIEPALLAQDYDFIALLDPDGLEWQADGQRCQPDYNERLAFFNQLKGWLENNKQPYQVISGSWQQRYQKLKEHINNSLLN